MTRPWGLTSPVPSENDVEASCKAILSRHGYWVKKNHAGLFQSMDGRRRINGVPKGTPDYTCLHSKHRGFLLEVKRPGGKLSDDQVEQIEYLESEFNLPIAVVQSAEDLAVFLALHERSP